MLQRLQSFSDFEFDEDELQITEQSYEDYKSKYFKIHDSLKKKTHVRNPSYKTLILS